MITTWSSFPRRQFLRAAGSAVAAVGGGGWQFGGIASGIMPAGSKMPPVAIFSKVYQELKLNFEQSAAVTAAAGLDGIDCCVRSKGEILPERAADDLPRYAEALSKQGVRMLLMTTGILGLDSPHAREILVSGKKLGVRYYRLGFWPLQPEIPANKRLDRIKSSLKDLAAMNRDLKVCALFENHSSQPNRPGGYAGGNLDELYDIVKDFDPNQVAVAFDLGHAIITHGERWRKHFEKLKEHIRVVYIKDVRQPDRFVPFGEGEFSRSGFFELLEKMNYDAPLSIHIEYSWAAKGQKTQAALVETLKRNRRVLGDWWHDAATH
jgi:sugar phosphate isomerase/epimerase